MQVKCPKCGYTGAIADELVPEEGGTVECPRCRERSPVQKPPGEPFRLVEPPGAGKPAGESTDRGPFPIQVPTEPARFDGIVTFPPETARRPRRKLSVAGGCLGVGAALLVIAVLLGVFGSPRLKGLLTDTYHGIQTELRAPTPAAEDTGSTVDFKPSYYEEDGTPVFTDLNSPPDPQPQTKEPAAGDETVMRGDAGDTVHVTGGGKTYHRSGCAEMGKGEPKAMMRVEAVLEGYEACEVCKP